MFCIFDKVDLLLSLFKSEIMAFCQSKAVYFTHNKHDGYLRPTPVVNFSEAELVYMLVPNLE